jgi:hypothetical protein
MVVLVLLVALGMLLAGDVAPALVLGAVAGFFALLLVVTWPTVFLARKRWRPDIVTEHITSSGERGVRIPQSTMSWALGVAMMAYLGILLAVAVLWELLAGIPIFDDPGEGPAFVVLGVLCALISLQFVFDVARGRRVRSHVVLTTRGVFYRADKKDDEVFVQWDSIEAVLPWHGRRNERISIVLGGRPGAVEHLPPSKRSTRLRSWMERLSRPRGVSRLGESMVVVHAQRLAVDPALAYFAIGFYWGRQDARDELGTDAGLQRIRSGDLMVWYPDDRALVLAAVRALADHESVKPVSVSREYYDTLTNSKDRRTPSGRPERLPSPSRGDDLVMHMKILFDRIEVLPDPRKYTGWIFSDDEVPLIRRLGSALDPPVEELGDRPSWYYVADPRWSDVVVHADRAARVMQAHG